MFQESHLVRFPFWNVYSDAVYRIDGRESQDRKKEKIQKIVSFIAERGYGKSSACGKKQKDSRENRSLEIQI